MRKVNSIASHGDRWRSPSLRRCIETAVPVAQRLGLPIKVEPGICEILQAGGWAQLVGKTGRKGTWCFCFVPLFCIVFLQSGALVMIAAWYDGGAS